MRQDTFVLPFYKSTYFSFIVSLLTLLIWLVAISSNSWTNSHDKSNGLFLRVDENGKTIQFSCSEDMSESQCQMLISSRIAAVLTVLWSSFVTIGLWYKLFRNNISMERTLPRKMHYDHELCPVDCVVTSVLFLQFLFGLLAIIFYGVFASKYYLTPSDDINKEGDDGSINGSYNYGFGLWITGIAMTAMLFSTAGRRKVANCVFCQKYSTEFEDAA